MKKPRLRILSLVTLTLLSSCGVREQPDAHSPNAPRPFAGEQQRAEALPEQESLAHEARSASLARSDSDEEAMPAEAEADAAGQGPVAPAARKSKIELADAEMSAPASLAAPAVSPLSPVDAGLNNSNTEAYDAPVENRFLSTTTEPLSTFSIDVDTASYSNVRRFLTNEQQPPKGAVRIEELINYFDYDYAQPRGATPFSVTTEVSSAPWKPEHRLVHIGLQGRKLSTSQIPARNLVFLLDVSGSMDAPNKLPLLKRSFTALLQTLGEKDRVAIAVYAGASGLVLPSTPATERGKILEALNHLSAGGSTNGASGIRLAYDVANANKTRGGVNRVILATDGDFNVGPSSRSELVDLIETERKSGVYLTVLGFGMGNYKDDALEQLADHGNGNYAYIDTFREARKVLVDEANSTLVTIAKDVKIQVEFNPAVVGAYRLIGYENRRLQNEDFNDDKKDAGEIGAGHTVTALYEIVSKEQAARLAQVDRLKYQTPKGVGTGGEIMTVKLRYKAPTSDRSQLVSVPVANHALSASQTSDNYRFSAAVAAFGMLLRNSEHKGDASWPMVQNLAAGAMGKDRFGYRREFLSLVNAASGGHGVAQAIAR